MTNANLVCTCPTKRNSSGEIVPAYLDARCPVHARAAGRHCPTCRCVTPSDLAAADAAIVQMPGKG